MTGPEHYRQAELHANAARNEENPQWALVQAQLATAHATLALAAAQGIPLARHNVLAEIKAWAAVAGTPAVQEDAE